MELPEFRFGLDFLHHAGYYSPGTGREEEFDREKARYLSLAKLKQANEAFRRQVIKPFLCVLANTERKAVKLKADFRQLRQQMEDHADIEKVSQAEGIVRSDDVPFSQKDCADMIGFLDTWFLPELRDRLKFGSRIYERVSNRLEFLPYHGPASVKRSGWLVVQTESDERPLYHYRIEHDGATGYARLRTNSPDDLKDTPLGNNWNALDLSGSFSDPSLIIVKGDLSSLPYEKTAWPVIRQEFLKRTLQAHR
jgi:hypothetical protein